jgi:hypothetical protein
MTRDQARSAPTYKNPGSCYLKYFPEKAPAFRPESPLSVCANALSEGFAPRQANRFRGPKWIHVSEGRKCQLALLFPSAPPGTVRSQIACNWPPAPPRSRHDIAAGICAIPDVAVANIPTECGFIQKFKDEISVIGAQVPQEEPFGVENIHLPFPFLTACNPRPGVVQSCGLRYPKT